MTARRGASIAMLRLRAKLLQQTRLFFAEREVLEVETPSLAESATTDPNIDSFRVRNAHRAAELFLHTSPELPMKRLIADGSGDIFQVCRVYRAGELGHWHEPEFTMLEWYRCNWDANSLMSEIEAFIVGMITPFRSISSVKRIRYHDAIEAVLGVPANSSLKVLREALAARDIDTPNTADCNALLDLTVATLVCPSFGPDELTFIFDYPPEQAALARIKPTVPPVAERFELFYGGIELANGFGELCDSEEQLRRFHQENEIRQGQGKPRMPIDMEFIAALQTGLPPCAGVAVGFDRLIAAITGAQGLSEVVAFSHALKEPVTKQ